MIENIPLHPDELDEQSLLDEKGELLMGQSMMPESDQAFYDGEDEPELSLEEWLSHQRAKAERLGAYDDKSAYHALGGNTNSAESEVQFVNRPTHYRLAGRALHHAALSVRMSPVQASAILRAEDEGYIDSL